MNFNAIVGNPPYNFKDGGACESALPLYPYFVKSAKEIKPLYISMIIPCRWFSGGKGKDSDDLRQQMLEDQHIEIFHDYSNPGFLFPNINVRGGVCYFLRNQNYGLNNQLTHFFTHFKNGVVHKADRYMRLENEMKFIRSTLSKSIIDKVAKDSAETNLSAYVSSRKPYGLDTTFNRSNAYFNSPKNLLLLLI